jgi:hypothetical protein
MLFLDYLEEWDSTLPQNFGDYTAIYTASYSVKTMLRNNFNYFAPQ